MGLLMGQLSVASSLTSGDSVIFWSVNNGDTRRAPFSVIAEYVQDNMTDATCTSISASSYVKTTATTVALLPSASSVGAGAKAYVTDASATTFNSVVAGGGSNNVPVVSDGTNWRIG